MSNLTQSIVGAYEAGADNRQRRRQRSALDSASEAYAQGDENAVRSALLSGGMLNEVMGMDRHRAQTDRQARADAREQREYDVSGVVNAATALRRMPDDIQQRWRVYETQYRPMMRQFGFGEDIIGQITPDMMTNEGLDSVIGLGGGEVRQPQRFQHGGRVIEIDANGSPRELYSPPFDPLDGAPQGHRWTDETRTGLSVIPGYVEGRREISAANRAPPRARSSGAGERPVSGAQPPRSAGGGALPPGFTIRRR